MLGILLGKDVVRLESVEPAGFICSGRLAHLEDGQVGHFDASKGQTTAGRLRYLRCLRCLPPAWPPRRPWPRPEAVGLGQVALVPALPGRVRVRGNVDKMARQWPGGAGAG